MKIRRAQWTAGGITALAAMTIGLGEGLASDPNHSPPNTLPVHFSGTIDDYTPSAAVVKGGPYVMHGTWSLKINERQGAGHFSAAMNMETSDYGITQGTVDKDDPTTRGAHTHHISMTDGILLTDWPAHCTPFSPSFTEGFAITGTAFVAGNGAPAPFGNPSPLTICVLGAGNVKYAYFTMTLGTPASAHFGTQAIHGVVQRCSTRPQRPSRDCTLQQ